ncbi:MAG: rhomboid family intramembrane serine protease [Desulfobacterales bacterium]|jgi:rhomboid protease GluP|nr:rhomboid family intramembrane serine protease [Desulfobacterales bacterium]
MAENQKRAILCPNCRKLVSADEVRCPYCGQAGPGAVWRNNPLMRGFQSSDQFVKVIIWANVGMFFISILFNLRQLQITLNPLSFLSPHSDILILLGATGTIPIDQLHRWWTLITANYLHGGLLHILFNMMAVRQLAPFIIREFGMHRMFIIYTLGGGIGFLISYMARVRLTIGASAALCALIGAALYYGKSRGGAYGQAVYRQVSGWVVGLFFFGLLVPGINNWGHGGGIVGGIALAYFFGYNEKRKETIGHKYLAVLLGVMTAATLAWAVVSGVYFRFAI